MARTKDLVPSYLLHRSSGQARVRIDGHDFLLGPYASEESRVRYGQLIGRHSSGLTPIDPMAASNRGTTSTIEDDPGPSVAEIILAFRSHADRHSIKNGEPTSEVHCFRSCVRILRELYGMIPAKDFGPLALMAVRAKMVEGDPDEMDSSGNRYQP